MRRRVLLATLGLVGTGGCLRLQSGEAGESVGQTDEGGTLTGYRRADGSVARESSLESEESDVAVVEETVVVAGGSGVTAHRIDRTDSGA